jgi:hypothetical protein
MAKEIPAHFNEMIAKMQEALGQEPEPEPGEEPTTEPESTEGYIDPHDSEIGDETFEDGLPNYMKKEKAKNSKIRKWASGEEGEGISDLPPEEETD